MCILLLLLILIYLCVLQAEGYAGVRSKRLLNEGRRGAV